MKFCIAACATVLLCAFASAQGKQTSQSEPKAVTVPAAIDHNRVVVEAEIPLADGSTQQVRAWVDSGDPDLWMSDRVAALMGLSISCDGQICSGNAPSKVIALEVLIGGMKVLLPSDKAIRVPAGDDASIARGMNAEINLPSRVLRNYDVLIDYPGHRFSIGMPGSIHFLGSSSKVEINAENGLIRVPGKIENKKYNLPLDVGSCISFLSEELFDNLAAAHPDWPQMIGAVGSANMWGSDDETKWKVMRVDRLQYGNLFLTDVPVIALPTTPVEFLEKPDGMPVAGLLGANVLLNYRVGLDYTHSTVYFDIGRLYNFPDFDVIGLVLGPGDDGQYTILGIADFEGKPSVPEGPDGVQPGDHLVAVDGIPVRGSTMGQVWAMLGGTPGQERKLTVEHGGKQFTVAAQVQHFLGEKPDSGLKKRKH